AQDRVLASRPYATLLRQMLGNVAGAVAAGADDVSAIHSLLATRPENRIQIVLITGEKGLCGAFNANVLKASLRFAEQHAAASISYELVGRKGRDFHRKRRAQISGEHVGAMASVKYGDAAEIARKLCERFSACEIDAVYVLNNEFKSVMSQKMTVTRVLPVEVPAGAGGTDYIYEQPPAEILSSLLPRYVEIEIYRSMLESAAAEHAARMTAMDSAQSNAADIIDRLTLYMNRVRQASITKEIIEVVSGAAAAE
ncbi:MAG: ATP synthase F1 subunit gamma, partial [Bryobacteraceae bacterium]